MEVLIALICLLLGGIVMAIITYGVMKKKVKTAEAKEGDLVIALAQAENSLEQERKHWLEKEAYYNKTKEDMESSFRSLSSKVLQENNEVFLTLAKETLAKQQSEGAGLLKEKEESFKHLVDPMKIILSEVKGKMDTIEKDYQSTFTEVKEQFKYLKEDQTKLQTETANLVKALSLPQVRGQWGELQLKRVVEMAGMLNYVDFIEQVSTDTDGGKLRPDVVINLPGNKTIVIDAKTPLSAYLDATEAETDSQRKECLKHHSRQVKTHIKQLGGKAYWDQFENSPEFVVLFLPNDAMYQSALEGDPALIEAGINDNVLIATPTTLIALLKSVSYGWNQAALANNARQISRLGKDLYDRMATFVENMAGVKKGLERSIESYNKAVGSFESRVLPSTRRFKELGISSDKEINELTSVEKSPKDIRSIED
ncbi:hypothetical protein AZF37_03915 [endosymbiont 'TC1' of Trimyema compressum]|uniref:DNA recombination protein RmuC n=1 Tax=endosymbiont 'TC1' of Trimyema compressum TaxID=243899 RepID=UPI0007F0B894|nr:DNA recombination protein RmuC [endosymbiont 'TC1' of Trimyema compressum]AMP20429.1 hypothetical protein AZF37_03915 [endosymbiont 'TC1' of Trimyema compressum]